MTNRSNTDTSTDTSTGLEWLDEIAAEQARPCTAAELAAEAARAAELAAERAAQLKATRAALIAEGKFEVKGYRGADRCGRCSGAGKLNGYEHICGGVCFACGGSGIA